MTKTDPIQRPVVRRWHALCDPRERNEHNKAIDYTLHLEQRVAELEREVAEARQGEYAVNFLAMREERDQALRDLADEKRQHADAELREAEAARDAAHHEMMNQTRRHLPEVNRAREERDMYHIQVETLREALLLAKHWMGCATIAPGTAIEKVKEALAATPTEGVWEKVRALCRVAQTATHEHSFHDPAECLRCALREALTALYAAMPSLKEESR